MSHQVLFSSRSDELLASLLCIHDFTVAELRRTLDRLRESGRAKATAKNIGEVYRTISTTLQTRAIARSHVGSVHVCHGMPSIVLEGVIQCILQERPPFEHSALTMDSTPVPVCDRTLANMSLVHRTWSDSAQRALFSCVYIRGLKGLRSALASPCVGPWTQDVCFKWRRVWRADDDPKGEPVEEVLPLLSALLRRLSNVRKLTIWTYFTETDSSVMTELLETLKELLDIEELRLLHEYTFEDSDPGCPHLHELCTVLPYLRRLRTLHIRQWVTPNQTLEYELRRRELQRERTRPPKTRPELQQILPPPMLDVTPSPMLEHVALHSTDVSFACADWLFWPRQDYSPKNISLTLQTIYDVPDDLGYFWGRAKSWFQVAQVVHLDMLSWSRFRYRDDLQLWDSPRRLMTECHSTEVLTLGIFGEHALAEMKRARLPPSAKSVHIDIMLYESDPQSTIWQTQVEESVCRLLKNSNLKELQELIIIPDSFEAHEKCKTYTIFSAAGVPSDPPIERVISKELESKLNQICRDSGVELKYSNDPFSSIAWL